MTKMLSAEELVEQAEGLTAEELVEERLYLGPRVPVNPLSNNQPLQVIPANQRKSSKGKSRKVSKGYNKALSANIKRLRRIQLPTKQQISAEQGMLRQLFGHGGKFFGSGETLPFAGNPDDDGRETWRSFGI